ncbi:Cobalamine biosynthesis protein [Bilophila wadsworthia]|uniref:DUF3150 domain-containing protein n=1 Tax=Bilophila TaxID=35832 RepID=UPI00022382D7|nr:DUF3150 domain-containing protein [Bilophila sp. 4_1_30]EGW46036.1 hypothetical protein HMPREF0178_01300 [Bilophila sp. 4_1_30]
MDTPILSDIKVLDNLLALNLNVSLWSARKKMVLEDFGGAELPPEDLASLGSKRIADPNNLKVFVTLKARAFNYLDRHGIRFMSGWAIPEDKAGEIIRELIGIRDEFLKEKDAFLADYDQSIENWINKHTKWAGIIRESTVGSEYVRSRMGFSWQLYRVAPLMDHAVPEAVVESGLNEEVENLAKTLFGEIARSADETWNRVYAGKTEVTHKALSPLRTLQQKLSGLTFINPHVSPVVDIIQTAFNRIPKKGNITGADLVMLQGLVCLLRDPDALIAHAERLIEGYGPASVLDAVTAPVILDIPVREDLPEVFPVPHANLPNVGLW